MPTQWAHEFYWNLSDTVVAPVRLTKGGYPAWQASVNAVTFWPPLEVVQPVWQLLRWLLAMAGRVWRWRRDRERLGRWLDRLEQFDPEQQAVLERVAGAMTGEGWAEARQAVRLTATTLGFNRPEAWVPYSRAIKADPGQAENTFRHLKAVTEVRAAVSSTLSNPEAHLIVELAYQGFAAMGR